MPSVYAPIRSVEGDGEALPVLAAVVSELFTPVITLEASHPELTTKGTPAGALIETGDVIAVPLPINDV